VTYAMLKAASHSELVRKSLTHLLKARDSYGTWGSTQATILSMKALILGTGKMLGGEEQARIAIKVNGEVARKIEIEPGMSDVMQMISLQEFVKKGANILAVEAEGEAGLTYQIAASYYLPWSYIPTEEKERGPLSIIVRYDRASLSVDDVLGAEVEVSNRTSTPAFMVIVDLGIPPGFSVDETSLRRLVEKDTVEKYSKTGRQIVLYFRQIPAHSKITFSYSLKARFPIRAQTPPSTAYLYYNPETKAVAEPMEIEVK